MKNNILFKFIAIVLCAASLLGAVGGIAGVVVLTECDLYNKTVPQLQAERIESYAIDYATVLAREYASTELGGSPADMVRGDGFSMFEHEFSDYGYRILDAEGNLLSSYREEMKDAANASFTFSPTGQYMHLVSLTSEAEQHAQFVQEEIADYDGANSPVPAEGIAIEHFMLFGDNGNVICEAYREDDARFAIVSYYDDGSASYDWYEVDSAGFLFCNAEGQLVFKFTMPAYGLYEQGYVAVAEYFFANTEEDFILKNRAPGSLFTATETPGFVTDDPLVLENQPMVVEEPIPVETSGWVVETVPGFDDRVNLVGPDGSSLMVALPSQEPPTEPTETAEVTEATMETEVMETTPEVTEAPMVEESVPSAASAVPDATLPQITAPAETQETLDAAMTLPPETEPSIAATEAPAETIALETQPPETVPEETEPLLINGKTLDNYQINETTYYDSEAGEHMIAEYVYLPMPEMTVEVFVDTSSMVDSAQYALLELVWQYSSYLLPAVGICLLVFAIFAVYLCTAAGRRPKSEEVCAGGLNRLPLDLYFVCAAFVAACCINYGAEAFVFLIDQDLLVGIAIGTGLFALTSLVFVAFCFAFVAQIKTPGGFWWRNTLCGHLIRLFMRFAVWLEVFLSGKGFPWLVRTIKGLWRFSVKTVIFLYRAFETSLRWIGTKLGRVLRWTVHKLNRFFSLLPLTWQWLAAGFSVIFILIIGIDAFKDGYNDLAFPAALLITFAVIFYAAHCFGLLFESTKRMSKGDLDTKVEDKLMLGCFQEFAADLNDLAGVAVIAAQKQLKSERMKTELITNVSHDIKTPLTSIINYVDLLQKPHTEEEEQQYLEVLDRQSQRLKKLIDDLMDMSKANTGNMQVDITRLDAVESINQALGEFSGKLDSARLLPVFRHDDAQVPMMADGKLVWRVLSNLLGNAVKYAMPGTRLYIDLMTLEGKVVISLKNISREELNIDAEELMERFVRGDDSRNTEGSGLGLNIAKSLMELQKGQLQLLVDGDLFKVTLIFPGA